MNGTVTAEVTAQRQAGAGRREAFWLHGAIMQAGSAQIQGRREARPTLSQSSALIATSSLV